LLPQIIPKFPDNIHKFVDLFGGGFNVGINVNAREIIYNDIGAQVVELLNYLSKNKSGILIKDIEKIINLYNLSKTNQEGYLNLRMDYNTNPDPIKFYTLICYSFNNQIRFNSKGEYNMPFGKDRSSFNPTLKKKFEIFVEKLNGLNCGFCNKSFDDFDLSNLNNDDFVYCDPPYFGSVATYNEQNGWTEKSEKRLLIILDELNNRGIKWSLSNNLKYGNPLLDIWREKYNTYYLDGDYSNCNYHKSNKSKDIEVLVTNYQTDKI
jgi:DNA adenine methylase Dam